MAVEFVHCTPGAEQLIVKMARVSNPNNADNQETGPRLLRYLIRHKHWSPLEMAGMCVKIETERDIAAQIIRHRSFSFQEFCLSANAKITVSVPGGCTQRIPIGELYKLWRSPRFEARFARSYDYNLNRFIEAPILDVYKTGLKPVFEYKVAGPSSEKTIHCTREHRVFTKEKGFTSFEEAYQSGLSIALNGAQAEPLPYQRKEVVEASAWMGSSAFAKEHGIAEVTARKWFRTHGVKPEKPNHAGRARIDLPFAARLASFMKWARYAIRKANCEQCGHDGSRHRLEISHIIPHDGNPSLAFDESNLQTLCSRCHRKHDIERQGKSFGWTLDKSAKWGKIKSETYLGEQQTYDIEMNHETHNFVANGIVVHNSTRYARTAPADIPAFRRQDDKNRQSSHDDLPTEVKAECESAAISIISQSYKLYESMLHSGIAKECARRILPLCTPTTIYMHGTLRSWVHYIQLRSGNGTQLEHQLIAEECKQIFAEHFPIIAEAAFEDSQP